MAVSFATIPSVDRLLGRDDARNLITRYGRPAVTDALRAAAAQARAVLAAEPGAGNPAALLGRCAAILEAWTAPSLRPVHNLTGTVLHTNLGRAPLPEAAIAAIAAVARGASNLEYDLDAGRRGERDDHVEPVLCRLTGAEAATVVNNNAAAVMLVLNTLALKKEVAVSRGELIEIGGAFRLPDIMARSGCRLREIGTTNRTHLGDYADAIGPRTGLVMKAHRSNYAITGFTAAVPERDIAALCRARGVPFAVDLGSGTLIDLARFGLPHEPTPGETLAGGADIVTFSGDKLLGGPQCGIIVGSAALVARLNKNPMKRALRVDKLTLAALAAVLALYADPDRLVRELPVVRLLSRPPGDIAAAAGRVLPALARRLAGVATVEPADCQSQPGSGTLPAEHLASKGIAIRPLAARRHAGAALMRIEAAFRALPVPVIGRVHDGALILDLRCLEDEAGFIDQLDRLAVPRPA